MKRQPGLWFTFFPKAVKNLILRKLGKMTEATMQREFFGYLTLVNDFDGQIERYWDKKREEDCLLVPGPEAAGRPDHQRLAQLHH